MHVHRNIQQAIIALKELGPDLSSYYGKDLLFQAKQRIPFTVHTGRTADGRAYATTRLSTEAWHLIKDDGTRQDIAAVDNSSHYIYGDTEEHAAVLLLFTQLQAGKFTVADTHVKERAAQRAA